MSSAGPKRLTIVACGAGPASDVAVGIRLALEAGWTVGVIATPPAESFLDMPEVEQLTGEPVRIYPRDPRAAGTRRSEMADAYLVAPATFSTINKLALGIADTYALTVLAEAIGRGVPVVIVPFVNSALAARDPYQGSIDALRNEGVRIFAGEDDGWMPHPPGTGASRQAVFPWGRSLDIVAVALHGHR